VLVVGEKETLLSFNWRNILGTLSLTSSSSRLNMAKAAGGAFFRKLMLLAMVFRSLGGELGGGGEESSSVVKNFFTRLKTPVVRDEGSAEE
jgi:hypothetical protein